jgi:hypothetical protein
VNVYCAKYVKRTTAAAARNWNLDQIGDHLQSPRDAVQDAILGHGASFEVGEQPINVEAYPRARHIDLRSRKLLIGLSKVDLVGSDPGGGLIVQSRDHDGVVTLWLSPDGSLVLHATPAPTLSELVTAQGRRAARQAEGREPDSPEKKKKTIVVSGRIKSPVQAGKPDRNGKPTAWARMAVYEEGEDPHLYLASFHKHTTKLALRMFPEDPLTVEGYPHPSTQEGKLDTFSVINIVSSLGQSHRKPRS